MPKIDPGHTRPVYVVGYSNGGRLAYRLACTDPTLFDGMVALKADPMPGCVVTQTAERPRVLLAERQVRPL